MRFFIRTMLLIAGIMLFTTISYADSVTVNKNDISGIFTVCGNISCAQTAKIVSIAVVTDVDEGSTAETVYTSFAYTDEEGNFSYSFMLSGNVKTGYYTFLFSAYGNSEPYKVENVFHLNPTQVKNAIDAIGNAKTAEQVKAIMTSDENLGVFNYELPNSVVLTNENMNNIYQKLADRTEFVDTQDFYNLLYECISIEALKQAGEDTVGSVVKQYADYYAFDNEICHALASKNTAKVLKRLLSMKFNTIAEIRKLYNQCAFLQGIEDAAGYGDVSDLFDDYPSVVTFSLSGYSTKRKNEIYQSLAGNFYKDMAALKEATFADENKTPPSNNDGRRTSVNTKIVADSSLQSTVRENQTVLAYKDLDSVPWALDAINYLKEKNIISGDGYGNFRPNDNISRTEFIKMVVIALGLTDETAQSDFSDVDKQHWAYKYVSSAYKLGITNGITASEFGEGRNITRSDMAVMLARAAKVAKISFENKTEAVEFNDSNHFEPYAKESIYMLARAGIINGFDNGNFGPFESATRAQAAKLICNMLQIGGNVK